MRIAFVRLPTKDVHLEAFAIDRGVALIIADPEGLVGLLQDAQHR